MAKLNVTIPASNVLVDGSDYRKVDRKAQAGDIVKALESSVDISVGDFFAVYTDGDGSLTFDDRAGDGRYRQLRDYPSRYEVYEKVSVKYREVKRRAAKGERIRIVNARCAIDYGNGEIYTVIDTSGCEGNVQFVDREGSRNTAWASEYVVLEPINVEPAQPVAKLKRLTVGDYAKVIAKSGGHNYDVGTFVRITLDDRSDCPYRAEKSDGTIGNWMCKDHVEPATEAEFNAQKRFKVGQFAKIIVFPTGYNSVISAGSIAEIIRDDNGSIPYLLRSLDGKHERWAREDHVVCATEAEVSAAKADIQRRSKYGDFTDGDYAEIVNANGNNSNNSARENAGKFVKVALEPLEGFRGLRLTLADGEFVGFANADALRKVTKAEYDAATQPKPKFSVGDNVKLTVKEGKRPKHGWGNSNNGDIGEVIMASADLLRVKFPNSPNWKALPSELTLISAEEIAEIEKKTAEESKWSAIGRKVNEYRTGDIVEITETRPIVGVKVGDVEIVNSVEQGLLNKGVRLEKRNADGSHAWIAYKFIKLIVPAEQRFDTVSAA